MKVLAAELSQWRQRSNVSPASSGVEFEVNRGQMVRRLSPQSLFPVRIVLVSSGISCLHRERNTFVKLLNLLINGRVHQHDAEAGVEIPLF